MSIRITAAFCAAVVIVTYARHWPDAIAQARHLESLGALVTFG